MEFVVAVKWLRLDQTIRNLICEDIGMPLVVIRQGVTGLKKTGFVYLLHLPGGREEDGAI